MQKKNLWIATVVILLAFPTVLMAGVDDDIYQGMVKVNADLTAMGSDFRLEMVEYITAGDEAGNTVFFSNLGNKQLALDFVPGDPRRAWSGSSAGDDITWTSDMSQGDAGVGFAATQAAINNAMGTWQGVTCSTLPLTNVPSSGNVGFLELLFTGSGSGPVADVVQAGFGTGIDVFLPPPIIAATFTFNFIDGNGNPTDIDNDGRIDVALREIYYTNNYVWAVGSGGIDIETVVLHETGHALSQAHFGKLFRTESNGKFHFAPRAVMNAGYTGVQRQITQTDNAGHCSNWANWPNN